MGVQQLIANNINVLIDATVVASTVAPSSEITRTGITRAGTGLVELSGLYTGHVSADYDVEIVTGEGNGRASSPVFSGVGSGTLTITAAAIPAQDVTITLLTPPYPGAAAEARIGADGIKAVSVGDSGNMINLQVNRSGLTFTASGSSTLEAIAEGTDELTPYKWDIPGIVCSADLKGNVPENAPRIRFGSDPTIYRIVKDTRSGSLKTILSPAAVRPIPTGTAIWITTGDYSVTVDDGINTIETYIELTTGYDLISALMASTLVQPAYTPAPVYTTGGNAAVDLPLVTGSTALLTDSSSAGVRPAEITARSTAFADTITMQCKGNGSWGVTAASGTVYPDAFEGQVYAPASSPVMLTIPAKPQPTTATVTQPVYLADQSFVAREDADAALPVLCIDGALGINAAPKTITATYAKRPSEADCPCPATTAYWNSACLGLTNSIIGGGDIMSLDPAYQTRLVALYQWEKTALGYDASIGGAMLPYNINANDIAIITSATQIMADVLGQVWGNSAGLAAWDTWKAEVQTELAILQSDDTYYNYSSYLNQKYTAGGNAVLAAAGIVPGKSDTPNGSTGCWEDSEAGYWWVLSDGYAPAFTGVEYYSTRAGSLENSQEFGFMIKCGCESLLVAGDQLTIQIGAGLAAQCWSSNEFLEIETIPTTPLYLAGGKDADDAETWTVSAKDSSNNALPVFTADTTNRSYSSAGLEFALAQGGIPYSVGDRFSFTVEGGTFKWRKDAGTWSLDTAIANGTAIDAGLTVDFLSGSAPSFVAGDSFSFTANQTAAATGLLIPDSSTWSWPDATATITLTMPDERPVTHIALLHSLPVGAAIAVEYTVDGTTWLPRADASGVVRDYLHVIPLTLAPCPLTLKALRITVDQPGAIRWLWAGVPLQPEYSAAMRIRKQFDLSRAKEAGSACFLGQGQGASIAWEVLSNTDAGNLQDLIVSVKTCGDLPIVVIPQQLHPEEAFVCRLADDGIEFTDIMEYQPDNTAHRILSASMELTPEWR